MVLGAVWCQAEDRVDTAKAIRAIKVKHELPPWFEVKWSKVTPSKSAFYFDLIDYFFHESGLHFRGLIVPDKSLLRHEHFNQDHDMWYYKMYFSMLSAILTPRNSYRIYIDTKDTRGGAKTRKLQEVLRNSQLDFNHDIVESMQIVDSKDIEQLQLADLLIGAVGYINRGETGSATKLAIVDRIKQKSGYSLTSSTLLREPKFNLFRWRAQETQG